jgi:hypothetical protein
MEKVVRINGNFVYEILKVNPFQNNEDHFQHCWIYYYAIFTTTPEWSFLIRNFRQSVLLFGA